MKINSLSELFDVEDRKILESNTNKNGILLIDAHNLAYRTLFSAIFSNPEDNTSGFFFLEASVCK